jgi:type VI protein secretion system component VasK
MSIALSTATWVFIVVPLLVVWVIGLTDILRRDLPRGTKAAWILIVVVLPVVGTLVYFVLRKPTDKEIRQAQQASAESARAGVEPVSRRLPGE